MLTDSLSTTFPTNNLSRITVKLSGVRPFYNEARRFRLHIRSNALLDPQKLVIAGVRTSTQPTMRLVRTALLFKTTIFI